MVLALVTTDTNQGSCPFVGFHDVKVVADTAWAVYHHPPPPIPAAISNVNTITDAVTIYPNPTRDVMNIEWQGHADALLTVYNTIGAAIHVPATKTDKGAALDVSVLSAGVYYVLYTTTNSREVARFIKY